MSILYSIIIYPITQIIEFVFVLTQKLFKETGISIIAVSAVFSILCLPLYAVAEKWQNVERNIQKRMKSIIKTIKAVFLGDERYMILSTYYRQNNYHPVYALRSSAGLLVQIPFFIAAYAYLSRSTALKGAAFLFIKDLGSPDQLLLGINLLPILMTLVNCVSGTIYTHGLQLKDKVQLYVMALFFLVLLYNSPAGLVLYWTLNNIFSLLKNIYYKIQFKEKRKLVFLFLSVLCALMAFYVMAVHKGDIAVRQLLAFVFMFIILAIWTFPFIKKYLSSKLPVVPQIPKQTFTLFLLSFSTMWFLVGLNIPAALIVSSPEEFSFIDNYTTPLFFIKNTVLQSAGFFIFWPLCLYAVFSKEIKKAFALFGTLLCVVMLCDAFLFPGDYGLISINLLFSKGVGHSFKTIVVNALVLCVPLAALVLLYISKRRGVIAVFFALCIFTLGGMSFVNIYKIQSEYKRASSYFVSQNINAQNKPMPIFTLSRTGKNVVVIMLDRAISAFVPFVLEENPELKKLYSGFTYYPNTVSFNGYTAVGSPPIFGGYESTPLEINKRDKVSLIDKHNQSLLMMPRIFSENGFAVTVADPPYVNYNYKDDISIYSEYTAINAYITDSVYTNLWLLEHDLALPSTSDVLKRNIFYYGVFKGLPLAFRRAFYDKGNWCAPESINTLRLTLNGYAVLDYLPKLTKIQEEDKGALFLLSNNTTHETSFLQAPEYKPQLYVTNYGTSKFQKEKAYHVNIASLKRLADWFDFLKKKGIYDNTKIIIVSDHGPEQNFVTKIGTPFNVDQFNPLLMVKDFNSSDELKTDMTFMSNADVPTLAMKNVIDGAVNPFTGNAVTMENKKSPLYIAMSGSIHLEGRQTTQFTLYPKEDYYVHSNIFEKSNWINAGVYVGGGY